MYKLLSVADAATATVTSVSAYFMLCSMEWQVAVCVFYRAIKDERCVTLIESRPPCPLTLFVPLPCCLKRRSQRISLRERNSVGLPSLPFCFCIYLRVAWGNSHGNNLRREREIMLD